MTFKHLTSNFLSLLAIVAISSVPTSVWANEIKDRDDDEAPVPGVEAKLLIEYQSDHIVDADKDIDGSQTYSTHELDAAIHFSQFLSLIWNLELSAC